MAKQRILVVDDEVGMLEVCAATLKKLSHAVIISENDSQKAAQRVAKETFDLLITDIRMPGVSGVELLELFVGGV